ncbi:MAG: hypothetical protein ABI333_08275 [bacterium]
MRFQHRTVPTRAAFFGLCLLAQGCCPMHAPEIPFSRTGYGRAILARGVDATCARNILAAATAREQRQLRELMFIANLQMAAGNEHSPVRLYWRTQRELAAPVTVSPHLARRILDSMARMVQALPRDERGLPLPISQTRGWELVKTMLAPAQGALPSTEECLRRIMALRTEVAVAYLYQEYSVGTHYHRYNMRRLILEALAAGGAGAAALPTYAYAIQNGWRSKYSSSYMAAVKGARQVLGPAFLHWYWEIRGKSYCSDAG